MSHVFRVFPFISMACALMLAACGGGGGDGSAAKSADPVGPGAAASYLGSWKGCLPTSETSSWSGAYTFTHESDGRINYTFTKQTFDSADCSGAVVGSLDQDGEAVWNRKIRAVAGNAADEVVFYPENFRASGTISYSGDPNASFNQILAFEAGALREGDRSDLDADDFPTGFLDMRYVKQAAPQ